MKRGVLDDNPAICHLLEILFSLAGSTVYASTKPANFVTQIDDCACLAVDFRLPGQQTGADIIHQARLMRSSLLISANPIPPGALHGIRDVEVLLKPFPTSLLVHALPISQERSERPVLSL